MIPPPRRPLAETLAADAQELHDRLLELRDLTLDALAPLFDPVLEWLVARIDRRSPSDPQGQTEEAHPDAVLPAQPGRTVDAGGVGGSRGRPDNERTTPESQTGPAAPTRAINQDEEDTA